MSPDLAALLEELEVDDPPVQHAPNGTRRHAASGVLVEEHPQPTETMGALDERARERMEVTGESYERAMVAVQQGEPSGRYTVVVPAGSWFPWKVTSASVRHDPLAVVINAQIDDELWRRLGQQVRDIGSAFTALPPDMQRAIGVWTSRARPPRAERRVPATRKVTKAHRCNACGQEVPGGLCRSCTRRR